MYFLTQISIYMKLELIIIQQSLLSRFSIEQIQYNKY